MKNKDQILLESLYERILLNEAIPLAIAKKSLGRKHLPKNYTDEMNKVFGNRDRIILPFNSKIKSTFSPTRRKIENRLSHLKDMTAGDFIRQKYGNYIPDTEEKIKDYNKFKWENSYFVSDDDYVEGYAYRYKIESDFLEPSVIIPDRRQKFKIGKILQDLGETELLDEFKKDETRQLKNKDLVVVISRHPYDIAGASTDRNWSSCINRAYPPIVYKDKKEYEHGSIVKRKDSKEYMTNDKLKDPNYDFDRDKCSDWRTIIAYLVLKNELMKNEKISLRKPISRMMFDDYHNSYKFVVTDSNNPIYGIDSEEFKKEVEKWMSTHFTYLGEEDEEEY
jgi:hypothetical protein